MAEPEKEPADKKAEPDDGGDDFAALLAAEETRPRLEVGQNTTGRVVQIGSEDVFVDVSGKGEAVIARAELLDDEGKLTVSVGDEIEATVVATQGELRLSRKLVAGQRAREMLQVAASSGLPVEGKVAGVVKGGFEVTVAGQRAFCPFSQIDVRRVDDQASYLNQVFAFRLIEVSEDGRRIVVSRRRILEEEAALAAAETRKLLVEGVVLQGHVSSVTSFGAFVDVGGVQGLVHVSEVTHRRIEDAAEVLQPGQAVTVQVLKYDPAKGKLSLSMRALEGDPWAAVAGALRVRQVVRGRLARVVEFGAFVELLPGVDGLLHVTELPRGSLQKLKEAARARDEVSVLILEIDLGKRRISLAPAPEGLAPGDEAPAAELSVGSLVTGKVEEVKPFGVVLRLAPGQTGVIPNNEMATPRGTDHAREFPPGTELSAEVVSIEAGGRKIRLSRARAEKREERAELERHGKPELSGGLSTLGELLRQAQQKRER